MLLLLAARTALAQGAPCTEGACRHVAPSPCWEIASQQCLATPGPPTFKLGPAEATTPGGAVDCNACGLTEGEGIVHIVAGQDLGLRFCIGLEAGATFSAGASICGFGVGTDATGSVSNELCVDTKRWVEHEVECKCVAGTLVHCRTILEVVPIFVSVPVTYTLTTCYQRPSRPSRLCDRLADGTTTFRETIECGTRCKRATDTRRHITADFEDGICAPLGVEPPITWKKKGG
jgi:hypothetical protein